MLPRTTSIWQRDSQPNASGRPGAVQNEGNSWLRDPPKRVPRLRPKKYQIGSSGEGSCPGFGPDFLVGHEGATDRRFRQNPRFSAGCSARCESCKPQSI
ncbi:hypothetical protein CA233_20970 [Sphingomonas sp. ABOLD]|nr:hypothetical protein CA233_20970 [Sphingomonas sp. ABOLD]